MYQISKYFSNVTVQNHCKKFLDKIKTTVLTSEKANMCDLDLVKGELFKSLTSLKDFKPP